MKNILFASSECVPFIKTGGLADVVGSLPKDFDKEKYDCRVVLPKYMCMKQEWVERLEYITNFYMDFAGENRYVGIFKTELNGVTFYFIDNEFYFLEGGTEEYDRVLVFRTAYFIANWAMMNSQDVIVETPAIQEMIRNKVKELAGLYSVKE
mgnify:CR=1 FL=1